jgi:hypothetical protein
MPDRLESDAGRDLRAASGAQVLAGPEAFPDSVAARLQALADVYPDARGVLAGGLARHLGGECVPTASGWWWVEVDGLVQPALVTVGDAYAETQDPPREWHAQVVGSERILWPEAVRAIAPLGDPPDTAQPEGPPA